MKTTCLASAIIGLIATVHVSTAKGADANVWQRLGDGYGKHRQGATMVWADNLKKFLFVGNGVVAFDPATKTWSEYSPDLAKKDDIHPFYQTAYDAVTKSIYCFNNSTSMYVFDLEKRSWQTKDAEPYLGDLSWMMAATDGAGHIVIVGSDKKTENAGWTRTVIFDVASGEWNTLPLPSSEITALHREYVGASEAVIDLVGRIRLAWYRDPKGEGTAEERDALQQRLAELSKLNVMQKYQAEVKQIAELLNKKAMLDGLKVARQMQRALDDAMFGQYPVPRSRRNAPLVYDSANKKFVMFGGDHEDYQMNDTWALDLSAKKWIRMNPGLAPAPRAGHTLVNLAKQGKIAMYEGYVPAAGGDYGTTPWVLMSPRELWLYDLKLDRWDLAGAWGAKGDERPAPPPAGTFYGYSASFYDVPAMATDDKGDLYFVTPKTKKRDSEVWVLPADVKAEPEDERQKLAQPTDTRRERSEYFRASFCEVPDDPKAVDLDNIPANQWIPLNPGPRVPARGARQRDWSTAAWDSDRRQVVMWGGGHCVRSSSVPLHYSPDSNRIVEGYDADEPYCYNGWCGPGSSLLNKQWIDTHGYHLNAYDPKCKMLVTARSFMYDPERMDWVRATPHKLPFRYSWSSLVIGSTPHGAIAWGPDSKTGKAGLWLFDRDEGWKPLNAEGELFIPYCDSHGTVYDSKRDRLILGPVRARDKEKNPGEFLAYDFKANQITKITPDNNGLYQSHCSREMVYVEHADWIVIGLLTRIGNAKDKNDRYFTPIYDCASNKMFLLEAGNVSDRISAGWMYDTKRKLVYSFSYRGEAWALKIDPASAKLLEKVPEVNVATAP